jgi:predicted small metal-binding protein
VKDDGKEVLKALIGNEHFEFDHESFKKIREDLINHRNSLLKLKG